MKSLRILPDTCAWIDFFNARETPLASAVEYLIQSGEIYTCGIVKYELIQGVKSSKEEMMLVTAMQSLYYIEMTETLWLKAGRLSGFLRSKGITIPFSDTLIAVIAKEEDMTILTTDRHFGQVPEIRTIAGL
jgi:predicted nucleic acid-binding protein